MNRLLTEVFYLVLVATVAGDFFGDFWGSEDPKKSPILRCFFADMFHLFHGPQRRAKLNTVGLDSSGGQR